MGARYHARTAMIYAIETELTSEGAAPRAIDVSFKGTPA
jgi:propanediol dehydratase large subunit